MERFRYLRNVSTLDLDRGSCVGCGMCLRVCPHAVFHLEDDKAAVADRDGCMECGACQLNCPTGCISVRPGVGCAAYIIDSWKKRYFPGSRTATTCC